MSFWSVNVAGRATGEGSDEVEAEIFARCREFVSSLRAEFPEEDAVAAVMWNGTATSYTQL